MFQKKWRILITSLALGIVFISFPFDNEKIKAATNDSEVHTVRRGDNLFRIAVKNNTKVRDLITWNGLKSIKVPQDKSLKLPGTHMPIDKKTRKPVVIPSSFKTVRYYDTNIHVYTSTNNAKLTISKGVEKKLEPLSAIKVPNEVAKSNMGFFSFSNTFDHGGLYMLNGVIYSNYNQRYITMVYDKKGIIDIQDFGKTLSTSEADSLRKNANLAVGSSYSLVQDGKKNLQNIERYPSSRNVKHPRTMFGQTSDGRFIMAVTDGRVTGSKGLTADESAEVMLKLGAYVAVNFDGGGSSTLIVDGKIKNKLVGGQRSIGSALFITK